MKFNWATGITLFFILFVSILAFILYKSRQYDNSLVIDNYYEEDINYQQKYDKLQNTADLKNKVKLTYHPNQKKIILQFPTDSVSDISGNVILYNPISNKSDITFDFDLGKKSTYDMSLQNANPGRWKLKVDWKMGNTSYFQEDEIIIQ